MSVAGVRTGNTRVLVLSLAAQTATMVPCFFIGSLFPLIRADLGLAEGALGTIVAAFFATSALGSAGLAGISDRYGPWIVARISLALTAILGLAVAWSDGFWSLLPVMALAGLANGCVQPATNVAVSQSVAPDRQGVAFGLKQASIPFAALCAGLAVPLVAQPLGWRAAYVIAAVLTLVLVVVLPRGARPAAGARAPDETEGWSASTILAMGVVAGIAAGSANAMAAFFVTSAAQQNVSVATAGTLMAFGGAISIAMRVGLGLVADRVALPLLAVVGVLILGGTVAYTLFATGGGLLRLTIATVLAFGMGWGWAGLSVLAIVRGNRKAPGRASGIVQSALFVGAVAGPLGFGWIATHHGFAPAWGALATACAAASGIALLLSRHLATASAAHLPPTAVSPVSADAPTRRTR